MTGQIIRYDNIPVTYTAKDDLERTKSILRLEPKLFTNKYKSVLYIGAIPPEITKQYNNSYAGMAYLPDFKQANYNITIVEIFKPNYDILFNYHQEAFDDIYNGDIENFIPIPNNKTYDVVFWWHGPEHVEEHRIAPIVSHLEKFCNGIMIFGCPWGRYKLGKAHNNPYEVHRAYLYPEKFIELGCNKVECIGKVDMVGSNMASIKNNE